MSAPNSDSASQGSEVKLKKSLGLFNGVTIIVGIIVGSGIFISPKGVIQEVRSVGASLMVWAICGVISLLGAMCYAELGTTINKSGGDYTYIKQAFGKLPGFLYLWAMIVIIIPSSNAITALTFANYVLQPVFTDCEAPDQAVRLLAALCICLLSAINCFNVKWATRIQDVFTVTKVLALIVIIIAGFVVLGQGKTQNLQNTFEGSSDNPGAYALAFYSGLYAYAGWNFLNFVTEELRDPYRNLPRAIMISIPLVTIIYLLANVSYFAVLTAKEVMSSNAVAVTFGDRILGVMYWIIPFFVACSTFGALNGAIFSTSRIFFVGARNGQLPEAIAMINVKFFTPLPSLALQCVLSLVMLCTSDVYLLITYMTFIEASGVAASVGGMVYLRYKYPDMERPIKIPMVIPVIFLIICAFLLFMPMYYSPLECFIGLGIVATGIPVYLIFIAWEKKPDSIQRYIDAATVGIQKLMLVVRQEGKLD